MTGAARDPGTSANFRYTTSTDVTATDVNRSEVAQEVDARRGVSRAPRRDTSRTTDGTSGRRSTPWDGQEAVARPGAPLLLRAIGAARRFDRIGVKHCCFEAEAAARRWARPFVTVA